MFLDEINVDGGVNGDIAMHVQKYCWAAVLQLCRHTAWISFTGLLHMCCFTAAFNFCL